MQSNCDVYSPTERQLRNRSCNVHYLHYAMHAGVALKDRRVIVEPQSVTVGMEMKAEVETRRREVSRVTQGSITGRPPPPTPILPRAYIITTS